MPEFTQEQFNAALAGFLAASQKILDDHLQQMDCKWTEPLSTMPGKRYIRIVRNGTAQRSVHAFIDTTNGDILKAAGWKVPAKHARGNIFAADFGASCMNCYGPKYLKR